MGHTECGAHGWRPARRPMRVCVALVIIEAAAVFAGDGHASLADKCGVKNKQLVPGCEPMEVKRTPTSQLVPGCTPVHDKTTEAVKKVPSVQLVPGCKPAEEVTREGVAFAPPPAVRPAGMARMGRGAQACQQQRVAGVWGVRRRHVLGQAAPSTLPLRATGPAGPGDGAFNPADFDLLRKRVSRVKEDSLVVPGVGLEPEQVISQTLKLLQHNDEPYCNAGVEVLLRLASDRFKLQLRWLVGSSQKAGVLSSVFRNPDSQFHLLMCSYDHHFPLDTYHIDDNRVFVDVQFDAPEGGGGDGKGRKWQGMLAKLGFEMVRREDGVWLFDSIIWHDFRDGFRPGIGQEEWPRICG